MMDMMERDALLLKLVEKLKAHGSWCGETHVQKATYLLQTLLKVPLGFDFILYKHGPFSFELKDELTELRADTLLAWQERPDPYGNSLMVAPLGEHLVEGLKEEITPYDKQIEFVASIVNTQGVKELEKLATAYYVKNTCGNNSYEEQVKILCQLKPHITIDEARQAVIAIDEIIQDITRKKIIPT